jgi:hypothetical protein
MTFYSRTTIIISSSIFTILLGAIIFFDITKEKEKPKQVGFAWDKNSKNIAALFTMTNENGRLENIRLMESVFKDKSLGFEHRSFHNKSSKFIYNKMTELAKDVGENGTLLIYLNSHGSGSGSRFGMTTSDGWFKFSKVLKAIADVRKTKRLIVFIDTCHASGGIQEGFEGGQNIISATGLPELSSYPKFGNPVSSVFNKSPEGVNYGLLSEAYEEALIIASSSVEDLSYRGVFATRLSRAFKAAKQNEDITVLEFMKHFASLHSNTKQKPYYKALPNENMLFEPLFQNPLIRRIIIVDSDNTNNTYPIDYIPMPSSDETLN